MLQGAKPLGYPSRAGEAQGASPLVTPKGITPAGESPAGFQGLRPFNPLGFPFGATPLGKALRAFPWGFPLRGYRAEGPEGFQPFALQAAIF